MSGHDPAGTCDVIPLPLMLDPDKARELACAILEVGEFDPFACVYVDEPTPSPPVAGVNEFGGMAHRETVEFHVGDTVLHEGEEWVVSSCLLDNGTHSLVRGENDGYRERWERADTLALLFRHGETRPQ